ncbi:hypothetical protein D3C78_1636860 [compost metagenome]
MRFAAGVVVQPLLKVGQQPFAAVTMLAVGQQIADPLAVTGEIARQQRHTKVFLRLEVVIERPLRYLGLGQQLGEPHRGKTAAVDQHLADGKDVFAGIRV